MMNRNAYLGKTLFLLTIIHETKTRNKLFKIYYRIQTKSIYTNEIMELKKIEKAIEAEQERMWNE